MRTIAEIGTDRLINVLVKDKNQSPSRIINILKSEITNILSSYLELDDEKQVAEQADNDRRKRTQYFNRRSENLSKPVVF